MLQTKASLLLATLELRRGSTITEAEIASLCRRWRSLRRAAMRTLNAEIEAIRSHGPYQVSAEATQRGIDWWHSKLFTPQGGMRNTAFINDNCSTRMIADVRLGIVRFELVRVDFVCVSNVIGGPYPHYAAFTAQRRAFTFVQRGWQSGGNFVTDDA